jgi:hypothetical protein
VKNLIKELIKYSEKITSIKIHNINGTSSSTCKCGSWRKHWEKFSGKGWPSKCPVLDCKNHPEVGAHVQKDDSTNGNWYIVPLCQEHNKKTGSLSIKVSIKFVPANVAETCGST